MIEKRKKDRAREREQLTITHRRQIFRFILSQNFITKGKKNYRENFRIHT